MILQKDKDPMGQAVYDYYFKRKTKKLQVYSDITEMDIIPIKYFFRYYNNMPRIERIALDLCSGNVLDVGAAAGCHSVWLQNKNIAVTALEISQLSVEVLQQRGLKYIVSRDFFDIDTSRSYDTLLFMMNGVGIAGQLNKLQLFFEKCKSILSPKGQILLDSSDISYMFDDEAEKPVGKYYGEVTYRMQYGDVQSDSFSWLFVDFNTLAKYADKAGLRCEKACKGSHFDYLARIKSKS
jgi:2-polyprenyl-3-methyl-5-hydroxy-6-metoxy-1,4-benzoquinol methylase